MSLINIIKVFDCMSSVAARAAVFVFSVNARKNKHNTYKVGKSFAIDCTTRFDKKI